MRKNDDALAMFKQVYRVDNVAIKVFDHWTVSLRLHQVTLGSMMVSSTRNIVSFAELNPEEGAELAVVLGLCERVARRLGAERINVLALMMKDPLVHFHVFPRYVSDVTIGGHTWTDKAWPGPPVLSSEDNAPYQTDEVLKILRTEFSRK